MRRLLLASFVVVVAACTFPDVDYVGGAGAGGTSTTASSGSTTSTAGSGSTTASTGTCALPAACATKADSCADAARKKRDGCVHPCKTDAVCIAACDAAEQSDLAVCLSTCESCGAAACGVIPAGCAPIVTP